MAVFVFASVSWVLSARKWFKGPVRTVDEGEDVVQEVNHDKKSASQVSEKEVEVS